MYSFFSFYFLFLVFYIAYAIFVNALYSKSNLNIKKRGVMFFLFLPLFILSGMRGIDVGGDLAFYIPYFEQMGSTKNFSEMMGVSGHEPGYQILTKAISLLNTDNRCFLLCTSFLSILGPFFFIYKMSNAPTLSVLMYYAMGFYTNTFNNVRQSLALSFIFIAYSYLFYNKKIKFLFFALIAFSIHFSAIVVLFCYPLIVKKINIKKQFTLLLASSALFVVIGSSFLLFFIGLINLYTVKYDDDFGGKMGEVGVGYGMLTLYLIIYLFFIYIYMKVKRNTSVEQRNQIRVILLFQLLSVIIQMYSTLFPSMLRLSSYFFIPIIVSIPYLYSVCRDRILRIYIPCFSLLLCTFFFYTTYSFVPSGGSNSQGVIPYIFDNTVIF